MKPLRIISRAVIDDLWGAGFTIIPRVAPEKVFDLANGLAPDGMAYQWNDNPKAEGWECVSAARHPGLFAPYGYSDDIKVNGLWLMERPKAEVEAFHSDAHTKTRQNVDNWFHRQAQGGFTGNVTVLTEGSEGRSTDIREIGDKTLESVTKIPRELTPYLAQIFEERDRLWEMAGKWWGKPSPEYQRYTELAAQHPDLTRGQIMNAVLTPIAIENIRTRLATEGAQHETTDSNAGQASGAVAAPETGTTEENSG